MFAFKVETLMLYQRTKHVTMVAIMYRKMHLWLYILIYKFCSESHQKSFCYISKQHCVKFRHSS